MVAEHNEQSRESESPAVESLHKEQEDKARRAKQGELDEGLEDTFPASDPVSATNPNQTGAPKP